MDVLTLSRIQFGATIAFHYLYPPLSIGLGVMLVIMEGLWLKTGNPLYHQMARFWTQVFALTFAIGVATGIVMEFEFGTNWATYSRFVGDVFGSALAAEGIFAFFLESGFLAVLLFGWDKVSRKVHFFSTCMVCLGAHFSAVWIVVANSWMQTPAGLSHRDAQRRVRARKSPISGRWFSTRPRWTGCSTPLCGAWRAGAFLVVSVSAWYLLKGKHLEFARASLRVGLTVALVASLLQVVSGHTSAQGVAKNQPAKLAAFEGLYNTDIQRAAHRRRLGGRTKSKGRRPPTPGHVELPGASTTFTRRSPGWTRCRRKTGRRCRRRSSFSTAWSASASR